MNPLAMNEFAAETSWISKANICISGPLESDSGVGATALAGGCGSLAVILMLMPLIYKLISRGRFCFRFCKSGMWAAEIVWTPLKTGGVDVFMESNI